MSEDIENHLIDLVCVPRVSNRQLGTRVFALPDQVQTWQYKVLLVRYGLTSYCVEGVYPVGDHPAGLTDKELLDVKDLVDRAIRDKLPGRLIRNWDKGVIDV